VVQRFAERVGDQERLDNLYLLTVADMRGTSPKVWNAWKDRLLSRLYHATTQALRRGFGAPVDLEARVADIRAQTLALLPAGATRTLVEQHWAHLEPEYFLRHDPEALAWHARSIAATSAAALPLVATRYEPTTGGTEVLMFTADRDQLFAVVTGGFDRMNLSIWDARIHTTRQGFALDTYVVLDHEAHPITEPIALARLAEDMRTQLVTPKPGRDLANARLPRTLKAFPIETAVRFSPAHDGRSTMLEVTAQDRPGLLYQVALALQHCAVRLLTAKIATYGERAEDIFFVTDRLGEALDPRHQTCLSDQIARRLRSAPR